MPKNRHPVDCPPDPAPEYTEWIQHRYDPGYWLGGRIPPYLKRKRTKHSKGNPYGYVLLLGGIAAVAEALLFYQDAAFTATTPALAVSEAMFITVVGSLSVFAGLRLIRGPERDGEQQSDGRRGRERRS